MATLRELYLVRRVVIMLPLGFAAGLPLMLTGGTLFAWARDAGVSLTNIGILGSISAVYALKFLWAPLLDRYALPLLDRRRGWLIMFQAALMGMISLMALFSPAATFWTLAGIAMGVALLSASQDIVVDAYRIDVLDDAQRGSGTGLFVGGYRLGMVVAGGFAFYLADHGFSWAAVYALMGLCMAVGMVATLLAPTASAKLAPPTSLRESIVVPLRQLAFRQGAWAMLLFVMLFKLPDVLGNGFSVPFLMDLGVEKTAIGVIRNTYGLGLTVLGALAGAWMASKLGLKRCLWIFGILQATSNAGYLWLAYHGASRSSLLAVISVESLCGGLVTAGFTMYVMAQCDRRYSAFQYALLTSAMALANFTLAPAGWIADKLGWPTFFLLTIAAALPGMAMLPWLSEEPKPTPQPLVAGT